MFITTKLICLFTYYPPRNKTKDIMSSRKLRGKPKLGSTPSSDDCDKDEHFLGLSAKDTDDTLVCLDDETLTSA